MSERKLEIEILNGPLDGHVVTVETETEWTRSAVGSLAFPWDDELGQPQGRFILEEDQWLLQPYPSQHGTYILNRDMKLTNKTGLDKGDLLKASRTWMIIKVIE